MPPRKIVSQIFLTLPLGAALLVLSAASSDAQLVPSNIINATGSTSNAMTSVGLGSVSSTLNSVTDILDEVNAYSREIQGFYQNLVGGGLNGILNDVSTLEGVLGIPDPNAVQSQIYTTTTNGSETDTTSSTIPTNNHEAIMAYPGRITVLSISELFCRPIARPPVSIRDFRFFPPDKHKGLARFSLSSKEEY